MKETSPLDDKAVSDFQKIKAKVQLWTRKFKNKIVHSTCILGIESFSRKTMKSSKKLRTMKRKFKHNTEFYLKVLKLENLIFRVREKARARKLKIVDKDSSKDGDPELFKKKCEEDLKLREEVKKKLKFAVKANRLIVSYRMNASDLNFYIRNELKNLLPRSCFLKRDPIDKRRLCIKVVSERKANLIDRILFKYNITYTIWKKIRNVYRNAFVWGYYEPYDLDEFKENLNWLPEIMKKRREVVEKLIDACISMKNNKYDDTSTTCDSEHELSDILISEPYLRQEEEKFSALENENEAEERNESKNNIDSFERINDKSEYQAKIQIEKSLNSERKHPCISRKKTSRQSR